jgi:uncharacterized protein with GYD domain
MAMHHYMMMFQYTPEAQAALVSNPEDRSQAIGDLIQQAGGQMDSYYYCFGEYDGVFTFQVSDDESAQAISHAVASTGTISHERMINLQTVEEKMQTLQKAQQLAQAFQPPSG